MKKIIVLIVICVFNFQIVNAACKITGGACSITDILKSSDNAKKEKIKVKQNTNKNISLSKNKKGKN